MALFPLLEVVVFVVVGMATLYLLKLYILINVIITPLSPTGSKQSSSVGEGKFFFHL